MAKISQCSFKSSRRLMGTSLWIIHENITPLLWAFLTFSPSFLKAVRISIFCCVYTSRDSFPTMTSRSICAECHTLVEQSSGQAVHRHTQTWLSSWIKHLFYNFALNTHSTTLQRKPLLVWFSAVPAASWQKVGSPLGFWMLGWWQPGLPDEDRNIG